MKNEQCLFVNTYRAYLKHTFIYYRKVSALLLLSLIFFFTTVAAQKVNYEVVSHFTNNNGVPQNSINSIVQDANGFIWMATLGGLVRYDGNKFTVYNTSNTPAMLTNFVSYLALHKGVLQVITTSYDGTLLTVSDSKTILSRKTTPGLAFTTIPNNSLIDRTNNAPNFLKELNFSSQRAIKTISDILKAAVHQNKQFEYVVKDDNNIWHYNGDTGDLFYKDYKPNPDFFLLDNTLYLFDKKTGLKRWYGGKLHNQIKGTLPALLKAYRSGLHYAYFFSDAGSAFLKIGQNLYRIEKQGDIVDAILLSTHVPMKDITAIQFLAKENLLLVGTPAAGLFVFKNRPFTSLLYKYPNQSTNYGQVENSLYALFPVNDSTLLTTVGSIDIHNNGKVFGPKNTNSRIIIPIAPNRVFINSSNGIYETNEKLTAPRLMKGLPNEEIKAYLKDADTLYLGFDSLLIKTLIVREGLLVLQKYRLNHTLSMAKNNDGTFYIGTTTGLCILKKDGTLDTIVGLEHNCVTALYYSSHKDLWIGTLGSGWYRYNKSGLVKMPVDNKGFLLRVHSFTEDNQGYLWMPTNNGMFRFLYSDLQKEMPDSEGQEPFYNFFDMSYGGATSEFNGCSVPAVAHVKDGGLVFPTIKGLVLLYPKTIPVEIPAGPMIVEDIYADTVKMDGDNISLRPEFNTLSMHVATPFYGNRYNMQLEYRLSGGSSIWTKVSESGNIRLNRLPSGNYHLFIREKAGYGAASRSHSIDLELYVAPHWYGTLWFVTLLVCLIAICSVFYIRHKGRMVDRQRVLLESKVEQRTLALKNVLVELEQTILQLKMSKTKLRQTNEFREQITTLVLHDVKSPLMFLGNIMEDIYASAAGVVPNTLEKKLLGLISGVKEIGGYTQRLLIWINLQHEGFELKKTMVPIQQFLQEIIGHYQPLAMQKGIEINCDIKINTLFPIQQDLLEIVIRNLLDNAIKYTDNGYVMLSASIEAQNLTVSVADTGRGMSSFKVDRLLKDEKTFIAGNAGLGYYFIKDVLKNMDGKLEIESSPDCGTLVSLSFENKDRNVIDSQMLTRSNGIH